MSKRKTRQEKIISDLRRQLSHTPAASTHSYTTIPTLKNIHTPTATPSISLDYRFFKADLLKTLLVSALIISIELILFVLMKR